MLVLDDWDFDANTVSTLDIYFSLDIIIMFLHGNVNEFDTRLINLKDESEDALPILKIIDSVEEDIFEK